MHHYIVGSVAVGAISLYLASLVISALGPIWAVLFYAAGGFLFLYAICRGLNSR